MSQRQKLECATCPVADRAACAVLSPVERAELAAIGSGLQVKRGETVFAPGRETPMCATLLKGVLKAVTYDAEGHEILLALIHPAGFAGEMFGSGGNATIIALSDARLCVFPTRAYEAALVRFPALSLALLRRMSGELEDARSLLALSHSHSARKRVAWLLMALAKAASHSSCHIAERFDLVLSRSEMAAAIGLTIETVSRQLTALEREGIIRREARRGIALLNAPALESAAVY